MKPSITLLVRSRSGAATALAQLGQQRAVDLGLKVEIVPLREADPLAGCADRECVTALVPVDFAAAQHEAWCLLCQLSLQRRDVGFSILVLGAESDAAFEARQRALLGRPTAAAIPRRRTRSRAA